MHVGKTADSVFDSHGMVACRIMPSRQGNPDGAITYGCNQDMGTLTSTPRCPQNSLLYTISCFSLGALTGRLTRHSLLSGAGMHDPALHPASFNDGHASPVMINSPKDFRGIWDSS